MSWLRMFGDYVLRVAKQWIWLVGFITAVIGLWALQENSTVVLPTRAWFALSVAILFIAQYLAFAEYRRSAERLSLTTDEGRKRMAETLVHFHGVGVSLLQNGPNAAWQTEQQMADWMNQDGYWTGEMIATVRERGMPHAEIHDLGVLGPPRHLPGYAASVPSTVPFIGNRAFYQSMLAERLHRIKDAIAHYQ